MTHQIQAVTPLVAVSCDRQDTAAPHRRHNSILSLLWLGSFARVPRDNNMALVLHRGTSTVFSLGGVGVTSEGGVVSGVWSELS